MPKNKPSTSQTLAAICVAAFILVSTFGLIFVSAVNNPGMFDTWQVDESDTSDWNFAGGKAKANADANKTLRDIQAETDRIRNRMNQDAANRIRDQKQRHAEIQREMERIQREGQGFQMPGAPARPNFNPPQFNPPKFNPPTRPNLGGRKRWDG